MTRGDSGIRSRDTGRLEAAAKGKQGGRWRLCVKRQGRVKRQGCTKRMSGGATRQPAKGAR
jgi:hypothetical protein